MKHLAISGSKDLLINKNIPSGGTFKLLSVKRKQSMFKDMNLPYVIAEIGSNHNGDIDLAVKLIKDAKDAGANCVKFQSWTKDTIFAKTKYVDNYFQKMTTVTVLITHLSR